MKNYLDLLNQLVSSKFVNIEDYYDIDIYKYELKFQGKYTKSLLKYWKKQGWKFEYESGIYRATKDSIRVVLTA